MKNKKNRSKNKNTKTTFNPYIYLETDPNQGTLCILRMIFSFIFFDASFNISTTEGLIPDLSNTVIYVCIYVNTYLYQYVYS
jgi:hypothetical protein